MAGRRPIGIGGKRPHEDKEIISHSVPADFYSSRRPPPPTPNLRPIAPDMDDEKNIPDLVMPGTSPNALGVLEKSETQGSYSLKNDASPLVAMSMPTGVGLHPRKMGSSATDDDLAQDMSTLTVGSLNVLQIIDEHSDMRMSGEPEQPSHPTDTFAAGGDDDGNGDDELDIFEMED